MQMVRLRRQYLAGAGVGLGGGILITTWLNWGWYPPLLIAAYVIILVGVGARVVPEKPKAT